MKTRLQWMMLILLVGVGQACMSCKDVRLESAARKVNSICPREVDEFTTLDSAAYNRQEGRFFYYYTVHGAFDDAAQMDAAQADMTQQLQHMVQTAPDMEGMRAACKHYAYVYYSEATGNVLSNIQFTIE